MSRTQPVVFGVTEQRRVEELCRHLGAVGLRVDHAELEIRLLAQDRRQRDARGRLVQLLGLPVAAERSAAPWTTASGRAAFARLAGPQWPCHSNGEPIISLASLTSPLAAQGGLVMQEACGLVRGLIHEGPALRCLARNLVAYRVHPEYDTDTVTGRLTTRNPNILGFRRPIGRPREDRDVILAEPGDAFIGADLCGIEARAVAGLSGDQNYADLFSPGCDIHAEMSVLFFGDLAHRERAKAITHGLNYGWGAASIAEAVGLPIADVQRMIRDYFDRYPGLAEWLADLRAQGQQGPLLDSGTGRKISSDPDRAHTTSPARVAQACARDLAMVGLLRLTEDRWLPYVRIFLHDEIVLSVPEEAAEDVLPLLLDYMTFDWKSPSGLIIPIVALAAKGSGPRWSDLYR